jgi:hypothetical protein
MGSFYTNITLRGPKQEQILSVLHGRDAYVSPTVNGYTVVYDAQCEEQDLEILSDLAATLSQKLKCPAMAILNHDDDILYYQLYDAGNLVDEYNSAPNYFESAEKSSGPKGGDANTLAKIFGGDKTMIDAVLQKTISADGYVFESERHADLVNHLELPQFSVQLGYTYIAEGEVPEGMTVNQFCKVP